MGKEILLAFVIRPAKAIKHEVDDAPSAMYDRVPFIVKDMTHSVLDFLMSDMEFTESYYGINCQRSEHNARTMHDC